MGTETQTKTITPTETEIPTDTEISSETPVDFVTSFAKQEGTAKVLQLMNEVIEMVLVDATERPIEHPKKDKKGITAAKRSVTLKKDS